MATTRPDHDPECKRNQAGTGFEGGEATDELQVLREDENRPKQGEEGQPDRTSSEREARVAEEAQVEHRMIGPPLSPEDRTGEASRDRERAERPHVEPAMGRRLDDGVDNQRDPRDGEERTRHVDSGPVRIATVRNQPFAQNESAKCNRDIDQEDAAPPKPLKQKTT